ncbi:MAG TPA: DUF433 domain-containing protein [Thermoguttaceae bacterium]|nr:DUF433 domain-containing protein [Thermoguttaceae bacterium]
MAEPTVLRHIESKPGVCGGKPCIAGTRIRVQDIMVWHELQGLSADEIVSQFPQLTLADVHAALAYYHDHREEIRRQMKDAESLVKAMIKDIPPQLPQKLAGTNAREDTISSG